LAARKAWAVGGATLGILIGGEDHFEHMGIVSGFSALKIEDVKSGARAVDADETRHRVISQNPFRF
jgi:hypothetical protein